MARIYIKIGDVFSVKINENNKKYFQLIAYDLTQLNSAVIRAFKQVYPIDVEPAIPEIIEDEVDFHTHCFIRLGVEMGCWEKVGHAKEIGKLEHIVFRGTTDYGEKIKGENIKVSHKWRIWHINDEDFTDVGRLVGENRKAEVGIVVSPFDIVDRITTGKYNFFYPDFE